LIYPGRLIDGEGFSWRKLGFLLSRTRTRGSPEVRALDMGAVDFVTKPYNPKVLLARARAAFPALGSLLRPPPDEPPDSVVHKRLIDHLERDGASFFTEMYASSGGGDPSDVADALWDLVWAGIVTNDSLAAVRAYTARRPRASTGRRGPIATPPHAAGRWYLVDRLRTGVTAEQDMHCSKSMPSRAMESITGEVFLS